MVKFVSSAIHEAFQSLKENAGLPIKRSQVGELISAGLGYGSHASLALESNAAARGYHLDKADFIVLSVPMMQRRFLEMFPGSAAQLAAEVARTAAESVVAAFPDVYLGVDGLWEDQIQDLLESALFGHDDAVAAQADPANSERRLTAITRLTEGNLLWGARNEWSLLATRSTRVPSESTSPGGRAAGGENYLRVVFRKSGRGGLKIRCIDTEMILKVRFLQPIDGKNFESTGVRKTFEIILLSTPNGFSARVNEVFPHQQRRAVGSAHLPRLEFHPHDFERRRADYFEQFLEAVEDVLRNEALEYLALDGNDVNASPCFYRANLEGRSEPYLASPADRMDSVINDRRLPLTDIEIVRLMS